jgi:hypothetical protein
MIEKRYRLKLNDKILSLRNAVPVLRDLSTEDDPARGISSKLNKGTVLTKATEYIRQLEREKESLEREVASLKEQLAAASPKREKDIEQDFDCGGAAAASSLTTRGNEKYNFSIPNSGMISPESCTSLMSPKAEGTLFEDNVAVVAKSRSRKRGRAIRM